jgi:hypothetical protein
MSGSWKKNAYGDHNEDVKRKCDKCKKARRANKNNKKNRRNK